MYVLFDKTLLNSNHVAHLSDILTVASAGADPGFLERGFRRVRFADFIQFFLNIP